MVFLHQFLSRCFPVMFRSIHIISVTAPRLPGSHGRQQLCSLIIEILLADDIKIALLIPYQRQPVPIADETPGIGSLKGHQRLIADRLTQILASHDLDTEQAHGQC